MDAVMSLGPRSRAGCGFRPHFCGGGERDVPHVLGIGPVVAGKSGWIWVFLGAWPGWKPAGCESL